MHAADYFRYQHPMVAFTPIVSRHAHQNGIALAEEEYIDAAWSGLFG